MKKIIFIITLGSLNSLFGSQAEKQAPLLETPGNPNNSNVTRREIKLAMGKLTQICYEQPQSNGNILLAAWDQAASLEYSSYLQQNVGGKYYTLSQEHGDRDTFHRLQKLYGHPELDERDKRADCFDSLYNLCCFNAGRAE